MHIPNPGTRICLTQIFMFIIAFVNGWARAINKDSVRLVYVGQNSDAEWGFFIDTDTGKYQIDEDELDLLVGQRVATILKRDLRDRI